MQKKPAKNKPVKGDPKFVNGVQGGWSPSAGRWLDKTGKFSTRTKVLQMNAIVDEENYGARVSTKGFPHPISSNYEVLELNMFNGESDVPMNGLAGVFKAMVEGSVGYKSQMQASYEDGVKLWDGDHRNKMAAVQGFDKTPDDKPMPNYMPVNVQTRLNLAEHYYMSDGDAANVIDVPIELLSRKIDVICSDKKLREEIEGFISSRSLAAMVAEMWSTMREYGQAYPFEVWDDQENPKDLIDIVPLPPKSVHIGYNWAYGLSSMMYGAAKWTDTLLQAVFPPAMFRILMRHWNDSPMYEVPATGVMLHGDFLRPIFDKRRSWMRYSMPMLSRGFRELVDRTVYEDSVRALVEGYKYQLWVFKLGDKDHMPAPQLTNALKSILSDQAGDRTGQFVFWDAPLAVEVHVPKGLRDVIADDYHGGLTKNFLRKMGINSEVIDGEMPGMLGSAGGRGSGGSKGDTNIQVYYERARHQSSQVLEWLLYLVKKWVKYNSGSKKIAVKNLDSVSLEFAPTYLEMSGRIEKIYGPMYRDGALSHKTYVGSAGLKGDVELALKEQETEARDSGLLFPPITFAQTVVNSGGEAKSVGQTEPAGSPPKDGESRNKNSKGIPSEKSVEIETDDEEEIQ